MKRYFTFLWDCLRLSFVGNWQYYTWMTALTVVSLIGLHAYCQQLVHGLAATGMTDQVSWGLYIANFTFLVGLAAAAAMLVIPVVTVLWTPSCFRDLQFLIMGLEVHDD